MKKPSLSTSDVRHKKRPAKAEVQKIQGMRERQWPLREQLGALAGTLWPVSLGFAHRMPTGRGLEEAVKKDPSKEPQVHALLSELAEVEQTLHQAKEHALEGLRQKNPGRFFVPFAALGEVLLEEPLVRAEIWKLRQSRWGDPQARHCLRKLGAALAWSEGRPPKVTSWIADQVRTVFRETQTAGRKFKAAREAAPGHTAWKKRKYLAEIFNLPLGEVELLETELHGTTPSEWALEQTAIYMKLGTDTVRSIIYPPRGTHTEKPKGSR
jgi:hypothetical protein